MSTSPDTQSDQVNHGDQAPQGRQEPWTVLRLLQWTTEFFQKRGSESPRLDAEILLAHARDCSRVELYTAFDQEPDDQQRVAFRELVRRRGEGTPVAQLVGYREFYSLRFRVTEDVLIPRPETEHLVVEALDCAKQMAIDGRPLQIADIGTGSGAIAVTIAKQLPGAIITAVDRSPAALQIAIWNAKQHAVTDQIQFIESDLLSAVDCPDRLDIICSNPPYVSQAEYDELSREIRDYEPQQALLAGPKGTEVIERIFNESPDRLRAGGRLIIEMSPMIADACRELANQTKAFDDLRVIKDLEGHRRILSLARA